jgi:hypothetical protein
MGVSKTHKILTGTVIIFVRRKYFVHSHFPISRRLQNVLAQAVDPAREFAALATIAARAHTPSVLLLSQREVRWKHFFGSLAISPETAQHSGISGTIIINTESESDFCFQIDKSDSFISYLLRAFMRRENPAEALLFLAEFAAEICSFTKRCHPGMTPEKA